MANPEFFNSNPDADIHSLPETAHRLVLFCTDSTMPHELFDRVRRVFMTWVVVSYSHLHAPPTLPLSPCRWEVVIALIKCIARLATSKGHGSNEQGEGFLTLFNQRFNSDSVHVDGSERAFVSAVDLILTSFSFPSSVHVAYLQWDPSLRETSLRPRLNTLQLP